MILTKRQIILQAFSGFECPKKIMETAIKKLLAYPEIDFQKMVKDQLNWKLEPVRKNTYIIT